MKIYNLILFFFPVILNGQIAAGNSADLPVDKRATRETINLYHSMKRLLSKGVMFGHQDTEAYGVNWKYERGRSDVRDVTGDYPAVYGYELGWLEIDKPNNLDSVPFDRMKGFIRDAYNRGGIVTLSWHLNNPLTGQSSWDAAAGTVASILPGAQKHELYKSWLDKVAAFLSDLKGKNGEYIPVIFRPYHELNGSWFWWGKNHCTPEEYKQLWHFTITYLRDTKNIHHLLYAFNTDKFASTAEYLERYPGDEWVDVIGFDIYQRGNGIDANNQFIKETDHMMTTLEKLAKEKSKIPAMTEFGYGRLPDSTWFSNVLLKALDKHRISFVLAWRNAGIKKDGVEFYVPYKGHSSENDFKKFYAHPITLFQKDIISEKIYSGPTTAGKN